VGIVRQRVRSEPPPLRFASARVPDASPDPWRALAPLGDQTARTATALAELAVETGHAPELWPAQLNVAEAVCHDFLVGTRSHWCEGVEHGKWLMAQELNDTKLELDRMTAVCNGLIQRRNELTLHLERLEVRSLHDISNINNN